MAWLALKQTCDPKAHHSPVLREENNQEDTDINQSEESKLHQEHRQREESQAIENVLNKHTPKNLQKSKKLDWSWSVGHAFMPEHHLYKIWAKLRLHGKKGIFFIFFGEHFFIKRHVPTCMWDMWSESMECRVAMNKNLSRFGGRKP